MSELINGARTSFGRRTTEKKAACILPSSTPTKTMVVPFNYDELPAVGDAENDATYALIPANAIIKSSHLYVETAFLGGTSYNIGLHQADGTVIDLDGIDAGVLLAALTANTWIVNDGAHVGAAPGIGAAAAQVTVVATGTFTAGEGKLVIEYIEPDLIS